VALAAVNQRSPLGFISLASVKTLKTPADLKGLNIGIHPAGSTYIFFKAFLAANGMQESDFTMSTVSPPYESYLLLKRVQVVPGYIDAEVPELEAKAGGAGSLSIMQGADFGWTVYGSGLVTSDKLVTDNPDLVKRFVAAYRQAFDFVVKNPDEAATITAKAVPGYADKQDVLLKQLQADISSTFTSDETKTHGLGWMSQATWQGTIDVLKKQGALTTDLVADSLFTDKFLQ
jgi:NitT/TauT family transport system substrate-binding protein